MRLRIGLVGAGGIGLVRARALARSADCELVAVADPIRERAEEAARASRARVVRDHHELLDSPDVDALVVSVRPDLHEEVVLAGLGAGKHVLCEKPLCNGVDGARLMVERARGARLALATGFNHRYFPMIQRVKRAVESGEIGELDHVRAFAGHTGMSELPAPWLTDPAVMGGGALMDVGIHVLDLVRFVFGEVVEVQGRASEGVWRIRGCEDNGFALLRRADGKVASVQASWTEWRGYRFWIAAYGTHGTAWAFYAPMLGMIVRMDRPGGRRRRRIHLYPRVNLMEKVRDWRWTVVRTFLEEFRDFRRLVAGERGSIAEGFDGFRAVEIAQAVRRSSADGSPVRLCEPF